MMYRKFIAIILGVAVAITGLTAAPARADERDLLKILGGVAAIAIIGSAIANRNDRDDHVSRGNTYYKPRSRTKHHGHKSHYKHGHGYHHKHGQRHVNKHKQHRNDRYTRPLPNRVQRKFLPASCRVQARTRRDNFLAYSNWCLDRKYKYARSLPRRCVVNARVMPSGRNSLVYANGCLSRYGYAAARY